jgi:hypothetical protein
MSFDMSAVQRAFLRRCWRSRNCFEDTLPNAAPAPAVKPIVDRFMRAVFRRAVNPAASRLEHMHDPAQYAAIVFARRTRLIGRQQRLDLRPLLVAKPKQIRP